MTDMPIVILVVVLGFITVMLTMGYIFRSKFPISMLLFLCGGIFLLIFLTSDNIIIDSQIENITKTGSTHTINYIDNDFQLRMPSGEPTFMGIMFIFISLMFIMSGGLVEKFG